jgi:hypothetical protein
MEEIVGEMHDHPPTFMAWKLAKRKKAWSEAASACVLLSLGPPESSAEAQLPNDRGDVGLPVSDF